MPNLSEFLTIPGQDDWTYDLMKSDVNTIDY
jgi:hypothetical protein